jgi:hypothetical protein
VFLQGLCHCGCGSRGNWAGLGNASPDKDVRRARVMHGARSMQSHAGLFAVPRRIALEWLDHPAASGEAKANANGTRGSRVPLQ